MRIFLLLFFLANSILYGRSEILENDCLRISVSKDGTLGDYKTPPGIQFDKNCQGEFQKEIDYLTPLAPYEYYSLQYDAKHYYANNGTKNKNGSQVIRGLKNFSIDKTGDSILTSSYSDDNLLKIEHRYFLKNRQIRIETTLTNQTGKSLNNIYFSRGLDPDIDYGRHRERRTTNIRGYNNHIKKDFVYTQSHTTKSPIGLYTNSKTPHNTSIFEHNAATEDRYIEAKRLYDGIYDGEGEKDSIINLAFEIKQLKPFGSITLKYRYVASPDIKQIVTFKSRYDNQSIEVNYLDTKVYKKFREKPLFAINLQRQQRITLPLTIDNIPDGIEIEIHNKRFTRSHPTHKLKLGGGEYNAQFFSNHQFNESQPVKAKLTVDNSSSYELMGDAVILLKFKPIRKEAHLLVNIPQGGVKIPHRRSNQYQIVPDHNATLMLKIDKPLNTTYSMNVVAKQIPKGVKILINGQELASQKGSSTSLKMEPNSSYPITISSNREFKHIAPIDIKLIAHQRDSKTLQLRKGYADHLSLIPLKRTISVTASPQHLEMPINNLNKEIIFKLSDQEGTISDDELQRVEVESSEIDTDHYSVIKDNKSITVRFNHTTTSECFRESAFDVGITPIPFTFLLNQQKITKVVDVTLLDIPFWEKWRMCIAYMVAMILLALLLYGYIKKARFSKHRVFEIQNITGRGATNYASLYEHTKLLSKLLPFYPHSCYIEGIRFVASSAGNKVIIQKKDQYPGLNINGFVLRSTSVKLEDRMIYSGDDIQTNRKKMVLK
jgi:hypothetical protein